MKPLIIYHKNCLDGFMAAFIAWLVFKDTAQYEPVGYDEINTPVEFVGMFGDYKDRDIFILDFSFNKQVMDYLFQSRTTGHVIWLDHHKTAFESWCGKAPCEGFQRFEPTTRLSDNYICLDNQKSGAYIAWEYFFPGSLVPLMVRHVDDRDRWQFQIPGTREFNSYLFSLQPWDFKQFEGLHYKFHGGHNNSEVFNDAYREGVGILRDHDVRVRKAAESARACKLSTYTKDSYGAIYEGLVVNCGPDLASDVGHHLANRCGTYGLTWYMDKDGMAKCSIRGSKTMDVDHIAKNFGGGGHAKASGFTISMTHLMTILGNPGEVFP